MNLRTWAQFLLMFPASPAFAEKKDLSPPPLNPHPKEAMHISVTFDNPADAKRYSVTMAASYGNTQRECGYFDPPVDGVFNYPHGTIAIPNESRDPHQARFNLYMDRYNQDTCNWETGSPGLQIHDTETGRMAFGHWGAPDKLTPGIEYKEVCLFRDGGAASNCFAIRPVDDVPQSIWSEPYYHYVPITVRVSEDSSPVRPALPGYFSHMLDDRDSGDATNASSQGDNHRQ